MTDIVLEREVSFYKHYDVYADENDSDDDEPTIISDWSINTNAKLFNQEATEFYSMIFHPAGVFWVFLLRYLPDSIRLAQF